MKRNTEGRKMWISVMLIFITYVATFILFDDIDRKNKMPLNEPNDWHLLIFSIIVMIGLGWLLYGYARRMDERISRDQKEKQDMMRRELTQNIAHELKTPVASILGYTDTILDSPDISEQTKHQFIIRTNAQARRLSSLLQDISTLNKMDYASHLLQKENVDISALVTDIIFESENILANKQMTCHNNLPQNICVNGNWQLLYSIFRNLMDNAINYAGTGTTIDISAEQQSEKWHFTFTDNGAGVPSEHLSRIFERFYRVDKGRSREMGGTGLGLSIVKNAVLLHGGKISAYNGKNGGLCFDFTIKK
jgi:signal transduction histidine kinase